MYLDCSRSGFFVQNEGDTVFRLLAQRSFLFRTRAILYFDCSRSGLFIQNEGDTVFNTYVMLFS